MSRFKQPRGAVATERGWVNPKTGELLVSVRGLLNPIKGHKPNDRSTIAVLQQSPEAKETPVEETPVEETPVEAPKPKRSRGKKVTG